MTAGSLVARRDLRIQIAAVAAASVLNGASFEIWAARMRAAKEQTGLDAAGLGFAPLGSSLGAVLTMTLARRLVSRFATLAVAGRRGLTRRPKLSRQCRSSTAAANPSAGLTAGCSPTAILCPTSGLDLERA